MTTSASRLSAATMLMLLAACARDPMDDPEYAAACHGPPLSSLEERNQAQANGYGINPRFDCIDKDSWEEAERAKSMVADMVANAEREARESERRSAEGLRVARAGFHTRVTQPASGSAPVPNPPAALFVRSDYESPGIGKLAAWVTPDPGDGQKHPAIVWITGGDTNSLGDFWTEGGPENDQSASAFRKAGVIMMFPTLRGGNSNPGNKEFSYGEVDDVIAASKHLAELPYVGSVFLGGHSTGGTLALLVAEAHEGFESVFAFGPIATIDRYPAQFYPAELAGGDTREVDLRSPFFWLDGITTDTYLIEGSETPGNAADLAAMCKKTRNPRVHCVPVPGMNHFSVLDAVGKRIAARIAVGGGTDDAPLVKAEEWGRSSFSGNGDGGDQE